MTKTLALAWTLGLASIGATGASAATPGHPGEIQPAFTDPAGAPTSSTSVVATALVSAYDEPPGNNGWEVSFTPYLWVSGVTANIDTPQGEEIESDQSFADIVGDLKFAFMGAVDARRGRFVTVHDLIYLSIGTSAEGSLGPGLVDADLDMRMLTTTHLIGYRLIDKGPMFLDIMAGARINSIKVDVELSGPLMEVDRDSSETKVGPVIASRFRAPISEKLGFAIYGDLGGFGVTSDMSWQLMGTLQYDLSDHWRLAAGWRHFEAHQDKNGFDIDLAISGPILGAAYRF